LDELAPISAGRDGLTVDSRRRVSVPNPRPIKNTIRLGLEDKRIHALILGYSNTIITPPMVFAKLVVEVVVEMKAKGIAKPTGASLAGGVQVGEVAGRLYDHGIRAYARDPDRRQVQMAARRGAHPVASCRCLRYIRPRNQRLTTEAQRHREDRKWHASRAGTSSLCLCVSVPLW
jgi:hypothetical protein